jgi:hypothetical protein
MFEQNRKGVKVIWRKLLDMELHELYHLLDTLVKKLRAIGTEPTDNIEEKGINVGSPSHDRKSALVSELLEEYNCEIFKHSMHSTDLALSDYHLFLYIKQFLAGQRLRCEQDTSWPHDNKIL